MTRLKPDSTFFIDNLCVNVKKIPFGTKWKKNCCGFMAGDLYKADRLMSGGSGIVKGITIHNTGNTADAETYARATFNQNMNTSRVHFYVDSHEAWQILEENEVGWHAGTGDRSVGNDCFLAIEIIMSKDYTEEDKKAEENGALLAAYIMIKHGLMIDDVLPHKYWSGKNCPAYILPHWREFLEMVKQKCLVVLGERYDEEVMFNSYPPIITEDDPSLFTDAAMENIDNTADDYALYPVFKAVEGGILKGTPEGDLNLHGYVTRQDLCVILERLSLLPEIGDKQTISE